MRYERGDRGRHCCVEHWADPRDHVLKGAEYSVIDFSKKANCSREFFNGVLQYTPESQVRRGILMASTIPAETPVADAARALGNGSLITAPDPVPFCIWMAAHHLSRFVDALGKTISADGDCDTNAAIVGGIVALSAGRDAIPVEWLNAREPISN